MIEAKIEIKLTSDQQTGYDMLMDFYKSTEQDRMFCLRGFAGTGKTFLIAHFCKAVMELEQKKNKFFFSRMVAMTAPTNKAVQVLREANAENDSITFKTIHSLLGLKEKFLESGEIEFVKSFEDKGNDISRFKILIIDEVSMLDDKLFLEIKRYCNRVKIIMMGDPAQIPPVNKEDCEPFLNPEAHGIITFQLTQIMRQGEGSAIIENGAMIRQNIFEHSLSFIEGKEVQVKKMPQNRQWMIDTFAKIYTEPSVADKVKVIAWTNAKVNEYNQYIRRLIFGHDIGKILENERLIMNSPYEVEIPNANQPDLLTTNQEVEVKSFATEKVLMKGNVWMKCYVAKVEYTHTSGAKKEGDIKIIHEDSEPEFAEELAKLKREAMGAPFDQRGWKWKEYYAFLREVADINYSYAISAHKSQGSSYDITMIDVGNICLNKNIVERNRILYTAITRARHNVTLII